MKRILAGFVALFALPTAVAFGQALNHYQPGPRLIDGSQLNLMVDVVNGITNNGGSGQTGSKGYFSSNTGTGPTQLTGTVLQVVGANATTARIELDSFGGVPIYTTRRANGTKAAPTTILSADQLGSYNFNGLASGTTTYYGPAGRLAAMATENWSGTAGGTKLVFSVTPNTTQVLTDALQIDQDSKLRGIDAAQGTTVTIVGGTSSTSANAGGAVAIVGGTPGATGVGGAVTITGGSAAAGVGGAITLTAGASAGSTNSGAVINLAPGAAVSTGIPGTVQIAGNDSLVCATYNPSGTPAATDAVFFIANRSYLVVSAREVHSVAAGGASALQLVKDTSTNAPGAGTDLLTNNTNTGFDLNGTANTVQTGTLTATVATKTLAAGDRLSVDYANTIQSSAGVVVTACMAPI